jgi:hypothetical protein
MVSSTLITRAAWGARAPKNTTPLVASEQRGTAIHYSAAESDRVAIHDDCARRVRAIQAFHMDGRGWADIAYNYLVCHHGYRFAGRGLGIRSAAQGTNAGNDGYHAVCFLGFDREGRMDVTGEAKRAIADCIATVRARYPHATAVRPHSAFHSTACPGDELRAWITAGTPVPVPTPEAVMATLDSDDLNAIKTAIRQVLNEGTGSGQPNWAGTSKATLGTVQGLVNQANEIKAAIDGLTPPPA